MGKLLHHVQSFCWADKNSDRNVLLNNYSMAIQKARSYKDECYCPSTMFDGTVESIFIVMWTKGYTQYAEMKQDFDWLGVDEFVMLQNSYQLMGGTTPQNASIYEELQYEFQDDSTSLIGLQHVGCPDPLIHDENTLDKFHQNNASTFDFAKQKAAYEYFDKHYYPVLTMDIAAIDKIIKQGKAAPGILRIDSPSTGPDGKILHGEQVHVHLKIGKREYALNIDGGWKHNPLNKDPDAISNEILLNLVSWGFKLPPFCYGR